MSAAKHTPRPWSVGHTTKQDVDSRLGPMFQTPIHVGSGADRGNVLAVAYLGGPGAIFATREAVEANANLIAAAPDLLEACKAALAYIPGSEVRSWPPGFELRRKALAALQDAIAAAEGRKP